MRNMTVNMLLVDKSGSTNPKITQRCTTPLACKCMCPVATSRLTWAQPLWHSPIAGCIQAVQAVQPTLHQLRPISVYRCENLRERAQHSQMALHAGMLSVLTHSKHDTTVATGKNHTQPRAPGKLAVDAPNAQVLSQAMLHIIMATRGTR